jgi:imidazolonepropionase-like amidohydrolase
MKRLLLSLLTASTLCLNATFAQTTTTARQPPPLPLLIKAGRLIDTRAGRVLENQGILVEGERIKAVGSLAEVTARAPASARVIDLSRATVLPGLTDAHTHILLQGDITAEDYDAQLLKESIPYRTIRATVAARTGLLNGFTAMRRR